MVQKNPTVSYAYAARAGKAERVRIIWPCGHTKLQKMKESAIRKLLKASGIQTGGDKALGQCRKCFPLEHFAPGAEVRFRDSARVGMILAVYPCVKRVWVYRVRWEAPEDTACVAHADLVPVNKLFRHQLASAKDHKRIDPSSGPSPQSHHHYPDPKLAVTEASEAVLTCIKKGVNTARGIVERTGLNLIRVRNIAARLVHQQRILAVKESNARGWRYEVVRAPSPPGKGRRKK